MDPSEPGRYPGGAFDGRFPGGRASGSLEAGPAGLRFVAAAGGEPLELPWAGMRMRLGGASDRLVFFEHPARPETSFHTADHRILEHPAIAGRSELAAAVGGVRRRKRRGRAFTAAIFAFLVAAIAGLVAAKDPIVGLVVDRIPPSLEVRLGEAVFSQVRLTTPLLGDAELDAELAALAAPLLEAVPDAGYPFALHLARSPDVNAFALPGGHVVVHAGLVLEAGSAEEVLGVLGHEIGHVTERHSLRQLVSTAGVFLLVQTLFGDLSGLMAVAVDGGAQLLTLRFSRDLEREADDAGWGYLVDAGIDPRGLARFFERLQAAQPEAVSELEGSLAFLSTHPTSAERAARLADRAAGLDRSFAPVVSAERFAAFQDRIRAETSGQSEPDGAGAVTTPEGGE